MGQPGGGFGILYESNGRIRRKRAGTLCQDCGGTCDGKGCLHGWGRVENRWKDTQ